MSAADDDDRPMLELQDSLPPDGSRVWYFPGAADHGHADLIARIRRHDGSSWIACLGLGVQALGAEESAFAMPCGHRVYLAGGVAGRDDPQSWRQLETHGFIRVSWSADRRFVVFCDGRSLEVFGPEGPLWRARDIGEIIVTGVTEKAVACSVYDPRTGEDAGQQFATGTGRLI